MDSLIATFDCVADADLMLCEGVAYQRDMAQQVPYDDAYYRKCANNDESAIADAINELRIGLVARHFAGSMIDVGIGSGEFVRRRPCTHGFDVNPVAIEWLKRNDLWSERIDWFGAASFWDVLEHVPDPTAYLRDVPLHAYVFCSIPVFDDLRAVRKSKHYRPGEHLYYWTEHGFCDYMLRLGFLLLESNHDETHAGRESIQSFAFKRNRWPKSS